MNDIPNRRFGLAGWCFIALVLAAMFAWLAHVYVAREPATITLSGADGAGRTTAAPSVRGPYLADIPGKPRAGTYFASRRVVAGYAGPAARYRRSCDGATVDVNFAMGSDDIDLAALEKWRTQAPCNNWSGLTLVQFYDQDGRRPPLAAPNRDGEARSDPTRDWHGRLPALLSGNRSAEVPFSASNTAFSALVALEVMAVPERASLWSLAGDGGDEAALYLGGGTGPGYYRAGGAAAPDVDRTWLHDPATAVRSNPSVIGWTSAPDARSFFARGAFTTHKGRFASSAMTRFRLGAGGPPAYASWAHYGAVLWASTLTPTEMQAAIGGVARALDFPTRFDAMVVARGDSILYGAAQEAADQRGPSWFLTKALPGVELFNLGIKGQALNAQLDPDFAKTVKPLLAASPYGGSRTAMLWQSGTNDLPAGRTGRQLLDDSTRAVQLSHAALAGVRVVRTTLLPRADDRWFQPSTAAGSNEQARAFANAAWIRGASGADLVIDLSDPRIPVGAAGAPTDLSPRTAPGLQRQERLYMDRLHPTSVGYASGMIQAITDGLKKALDL